MSDRWIVIPRWDEFQHYKDRDPKWIKDYRRQYSDEAYLALSFHLRGILLGLRHSYAASNRQISDSTLTLTRRLGQRVTRRDLEALNHAGFIQFSASKPLAEPYQPASPEKEKEKEPPISPMGSASAAHGGSGSENKPGELTGDALKVSRLITNGVIQNEVDLVAELNGYEIPGHLAEVLRDQLARRLEFH